MPRTTEKVITKDGKKLLESTTKTTMSKDVLVKKLDAIAVWQSEENVRHDTRIAELDVAEAALAKKIAKL